MKQYMKMRKKWRLNGYNKFIINKGDKMYLFTNRLNLKGFVQKILLENQTDKIIYVLGFTFGYLLGFTIAKFICWIVL